MLSYSSTGTEHVFLIIPTSLEASCWSQQCPHGGHGNEDDRKWAGVAWENNVPCENMHGAVIKGPSLESLSF